MIPFTFAFIMIGCTSNPSEQSLAKPIEWKAQLQSQLSEFGHRNWILIVDKAYPSQNSLGVITIDTHDDLLNV
jgi:hypothetical protein